MINKVLIRSRLALIRFVPFSYFCTCWKVRPSAAPSFCWLIASTLRRIRTRLPEMLRQVISQQGDAAHAAANLKEGQDVVFNSLQQRFNSISSVNIDEEMANLLNLQNAYAANARVMSTVKEMLDTLLKI